MSRDRNALSTSGQGRNIRAGGTLWVLPSAHAYTGAEGAACVRVSEFFRSSCFSLGFVR